jgi:hypothetical protein
MKIQLESNLKPRPARLRCIACEHTFASGKLRTLLYHQDESLAGDICRECFQRGASHIQQQLKARAIALFQQPAIEDVSPSPHKQALELWELATTRLVLPSIYDRLWQRLRMFAAGTKDLELAKTRAHDLRSRQPKPPTITFVEEEPQIGKDN